MFALLAFCSFAATQAFALPTVWLEGSVVPKEWLLVLSEGELELADLGAPGGVVTVLCSGLNEGWIASHLVSGVLTFNAAADEITKITNLAGTSNTVECTFVNKGLCEASSVPTAEAINLPWLTELNLVGTVVLDLLFSENTEAIGWKVLCLALGLNMEDKCTVPGTEAKPGETEINNTTEGDVLASFSEAIQKEKAACSLSKEMSGVVTGSILIFTESGETLAVSEE